MANTNNYGVVILSKVKSVYNGNIFSVQSDEELENGFIGHLGDLVTGEREIRKFEKPTTDSMAKNGVVLIGHYEINYDETYQSNKLLQNFKIDAKTPARAYELLARDSYEVSKDLITALDSGKGVVIGNYVTATNNSFKYTEVSTLPDVSTACFVAKIIGKRTLGTVTNVGSNGNVTGAIELVELEVIRNINA